MQDKQTGQMKPLNEKTMENEGEQASKDEVQPERSQQSP